MNLIEHIVKVDDSAYTVFDTLPLKIENISSNTFERIPILE